MRLNWCAKVGSESHRSAVKSLTSEAQPFASMSHSDRCLSACLDGAWRSATFSGVDQLFANLIGPRGSLKSLFIQKYCKSLPEQIVKGFPSLSRVTFSGVDQLFANVRGLDGLMASLFIPSC